MSTGRSFWVFLTLLLAVSVFVTVAAIVGTSGSASPAASEFVASQPTQERSQPTFAFMGDSYAGGSAMGGGGSANISQIVAKENGARAYNVAVGGTGYVNPGGQAPFEVAQAAPVERLNPDVIVIVGSVNDSGQRPDAVLSAASRLFVRLKKDVPRARLVVVGPVSPNPSDPGDDVSAARDAVREAAQSTGVIFLDPISEGWLANKSFIGRDGVHPTDQGHQHMADVLQNDLMKASVVPIR